MNDPLPDNITNINQKSFVLDPLSVIIKLAIISEPLLTGVNPCLFKLLINPRSSIPPAVSLLLELLLLFICDISIWV